MATNNLFDKELYPTPVEVISKMVQPYKLKGRQILEPSAGSGAILDYITGSISQYTPHHTDVKNVWALEINDNCQYILQGKGYRILGADFLTYKPTHCFDMIIMNPPFSNGDEHLLHAWEIMHTGDICCLLNAETINNPCTARRKLLAGIIKDHGSVELLGNCFKDAMRKTDVNVAMVRLHKELKDTRWEINFDSSARMEGTVNFAEAVNAGTELAIDDKLGSYLHAWDSAKEAAVEFIKARKKLEYYVTAFMPVDEVSKLVTEQCQHMRGQANEMQAAYNVFLERAKSKAWKEIIHNMGMDKYMTANLRKTFDQFCECQGAYELNRENILNLVRFVALNSRTILNKAVVDLYDRFISFYKGNAILEEGWKTNSQFKVNKKVILPAFVECSYSRTYHAQSYRWDEYRDIDKVMCYLSGTPYERLNELTQEAKERKAQNPYTFKAEDKDYNVNLLSLTRAVEMVQVGDSSLHECAFFQFRCYKKGTLHIIFKSEELWARFNLTVNEGKNQLGNGK